MVLVCVATAFEGALLSERVANRADVKLVITGIGPVNAAHAATVGILERRLDAVVVCGIAGAYPGSGLRVGDVASAESECYGDLGAASPNGFLDMKAMGFPIIDGPDPVYNELPMQVFPTSMRVRFVTVSTCTGTDEMARSIESRTRGAVENMEGAAIAHVARLHGVPVGEVRGISNLVTNRDTSQWRTKEAAAAAQEALLAWIAKR
jgi:futalosine hydrolase